MHHIMASAFVHLVRDLTESCKVEEARVGGVARDDQLRLEFDRRLFQLVVVDQLSLLWMHKVSPFSSKNLKVRTLIQCVSSFNTINC